MCVFGEMNDPTKITIKIVEWIRFESCPFFQISVFVKQYAIQTDMNGEA